MGRSTTIFSTVLAALIALAIAAAGPAPAATTEPDQAAAGEPGRDYAADQLIVRLRGGGERLLELPSGVSVEAAASALGDNPRVAYAVPNYIAHAAAAGTSWIPNDPGAGTTHGGWQATQWNFLPCGSGCAPGTQPLAFESKGGINAPGAWAALRAGGHGGGAGVKVAVLDTGVAFRNLRPKYAKSPDFARRQFLSGHDFVDNDPLALDEDGHGTHVAGTIAEQTGNGKGLTGLAYGAKLIPVRVLDQAGEGKAREIAQGIMFAVRHGARVINMSFEFGGFVQSCKQVKGVCRAVRYANRQGATVVAADGNDTSALAAFPARIPGVIGVGATTEGGCLADYSSYGYGLDLVAPGGRGEGATVCRTADRPIFQVTMLPPSLTNFGVPTDYSGTSMAAAHVSALAAMVISSGVIGAHPGPLRIQCQLAATARKTNLGEPYDVNRFGGGLIDAAAAVTQTAC
jgi:serine protease